LRRVEKKVDFKIFSKRKREGDRSDIKKFEDKIL
jgi:hypothetical protein